MKLSLIKPLIQLIVILFSAWSIAQNNVTNLLDSSDWNDLFPKRAGTTASHPQGYTIDFYSYDNFKTAVDDMSDYVIEIRKKPGVWGELSTITKKSTNISYVYSDVDSWWHTNPTQEIVINVDFADFVNRSSQLNNKRELAAFLANISKETTGGWHPIGSGHPGDYADWGLYFVHEVGLTSSSCDPNVYNDTGNTEYPGTAGQCYFGRGPIQLSWNYNYGQFSKFLYNDVSVLLDNPDLVQQDGVLAFKSAIWFWMMPQCPKPSCHQVMHELWSPESGTYSQTKMYKKGFAHTNNIINGGLECRTMSSSAFTQKVVLRSELYKYYLSILGFLSSDIAAEDSGDYSTLCYESVTNAMEDYTSCNSNVLGISTNELNKLKIYPNPAKSNFTIRNTHDITSIEIFNIIGKKIYDITPYKKEVFVDISTCSTGLYFVSVKSKNNKSIVKLYIE